MKNETISDLVKTWIPNGLVLGTIHAVEVKADLEIALLVLSIVYTGIRLGMLIKHRGRETNDPPGTLDDIEEP
jgi:hypothetical protein